MSLLLLSVAIVGFLAYANGANDNFKGVATLYGSGTTNFQSALMVATVATALGSIAALIAAQGLLTTFSGKGLVPNSVLAIKSFSLAVVLAAASTVMLATKLGFPISTTHALTGALVGAGLFASPAGVNLSKLGSSFFLPLLLSPVIAVTLAGLGYWWYRKLFAATALADDGCICIGEEAVAPPSTAAAAAIALAPPATVLKMASSEECAASLAGPFWAIGTRGVLDNFHCLSASIVCFARALNDTPKIAAMLLVGSVLSPTAGIALVALFMAAGGILNSRKIAETMSHKVTEMDARQGFTANLVTGLLVIGASKFALPVSTTHVSCGALFGIGAVTGQAHVRMILSILLAWVTTLPVAAVLGAVLFQILNRVV